VEYVVYIFGLCPALLYRLLSEGGDSTEASDKEAGVDVLDGAEVKASLAEEGVDDAVEDGDHDDYGDGVQVLDEIIESTMQHHTSRHSPGNSKASRRGGRGTPCKH